MSTPSQLLGDATWLRSVRLHGGDPDRLRARQRLEQALARVDWACTGQSARSVLLVRHLRARPGAGGGLGADIARALHDKARHARRPWTQPEAAAAEAVWFADPDELAACLVRDWLAGALPERWWWPGMLAGAGVDRWLHEQVLTRGQRLVPVIALLGERGDAVRWMARLDDASASLALSAIAQSHGVPAAAAAPADRPTASSSAAVEAGAAAAPEDERGTATAHARHLDRLVPEMRATLPTAATRLLAWALALAREPGFARRPAFARALEARLAAPAPLAARPAADRRAPRAWADGVAADRSSLAPDSLAASHAGSHPPDTRDPIEHGQSRTARAAASSRPPPPPDDAQRHAVGAAPLAPPATASPRAHVTPAPAAREARPSTPPEHPTAADAADAARMTTSTDDTDAPPRPARTAARASEQRPTASVPCVVHTRFGGVFYLLNAALAMGLYGDFTQPRTPGIALSPWDWLAWVGQDGLGAEFVDDPAWALLAELAGRRPQDAPGHDFDAPRTWQLASDALAPWRPVARVGYRASRTRLRIEHPAAFPLFDGPRERGLAPRLQAARLLRELPALGAAALRRGPPAPRCAPAPRSHRGRWLAAMSACLRARLARALGLDDPAAAIALACRQAATLRVGHGAVDVHLALAELPLAIRFAGLDRDPGWIPAAGRSVAFHFD